jgi:hypothetical protein
MSRKSKRLVRDLTDDDYEINDGREHQARDGSNLRTMAEAEAEQRRPLPMRRQRQPVQNDGLVRSLWRLVTLPIRVPFWAARAAVQTMRRPDYLASLKA